MMGMLTVPTKAKIAAAVPVLAAMLAIPMQAVPVMAASLMLGSGLLSFIGSIGAALTVSLRSGGLLVSLLVLPLCVPIIIFGSHTIQSAIDGWPVSAGLAMLGGLFVAALCIAPLATVAALRMSMDS